MKRSEVVRKLKVLHRTIDGGLLMKNESVRVAELFERWFNDIMRHRVAPSTFSNYQAFRKAIDEPETSFMQSSSAPFGSCTTTGRIRS
jgi:hypothetical protein